MVLLCSATTVHDSLCLMVADLYPRLISHSNPENPLTMVSLPQGTAQEESQRNGTILHVSRNACWEHGYVMFSLATIFEAANNVCVCGKMMIHR